MNDLPISVCDLPKDIFSQCRQFLTESNVDGSLKILRDAGYSKSDSIWLMKGLLYCIQHQKISFSEATQLVHLSNVWKDCREQDDKIQESFLDFLDEI